MYKTPSKMSNILMPFDEPNGNDAFTSTSANQHISSIYKVNNNNCVKNNCYNCNKKGNINKHNISDNNNKSSNNSVSDDSYDSSPSDVIYINNNDNLSNVIISSSATSSPSLITVAKTNATFGTSTNCTKATLLPNEAISNELVSSEDLSQSPSEYTDADESISAPTEFLAEFLSAVMVRDYKKAMKYCKLILQYEPNNATAQEFYPLIVNKLRAVHTNEKYNSHSIATSSVKLAFNMNSSKTSTIKEKQLIAAFGRYRQPAVIAVANLADNISDDNQLGTSTNYNTVVNTNNGAENDKYGSFSNLNDATVSPSMFIAPCYSENVIGIHEGNFNDDNSNHNKTDDADENVDLDDDVAVDGDDDDDNVDVNDDFHIDSDDVAGNCDDDANGVIEVDDDTSSSSGDDLPVDEHELHEAIAIEIMELELFINQGNTSNATSINSSSGGKANSRSDNTSYSYSSLLLEEDDDTGLLNINSIKPSNDIENINGV